MADIPGNPITPGPTAVRWSDEFLDYYRLIGDTEADAAVAEILRHPQWDAPNFFRWLVRNDAPVPADIPPAVAHYFSGVAFPSWADMELIEEGEKVFRAWGPQISLTLFCASLPVGYSADRVVRILEATGRLETDALRRVFETAQLLFDLLDVGGLRPDGKGLRSIQRVRLMHAAVRHLIAHKDEALSAQAAAEGRAPTLIWPVEWGKPINQEDLAATLLTFTVVPFDGLAKLGIKLTPRQREGYLHLWRVAGHFLGITEEVLPRDEDDARALWAAEERRQLYHRSEAGLHLTKALLGAFSEIVPGRTFDFFTRGMVRHLSGARAADVIGVPRLRWGGHVLFVLAMRAEKWFVRQERTHSSFFSVSSRYQRAMLNGLVYHTPANFSLPDHLAEHWGMDVPTPPADAAVASVDEGTPVGRA